MYQIKGFLGSSFLPCNAFLMLAPKTMRKAAIIDGKAIAQKIREEIMADILKLKCETNKVPGLAVVLVGARKDSETYVRSKKKACDEVGITSFGVNLPEDSSEEEVLQHVRAFNEDPAVHGILVQLPLPKVWTFSPFHCYEREKLLGHFYIMSKALNFLQNYQNT